MKLRLIGRDLVEELVDPDQLVDVLAQGFENLTRGRTSMPPRSEIETDSGFLYLMGGWLGSDEMAVKLVSQFPENTDHPLHQAVVLLFDSGNGSPVALLDGESITSLRTAAVSRLATRLLALPDATRTAVIGAGVQGRAHLSALARDRRLSVTVADRETARADGLASWARTELGVECSVAPTVEAALEGAEIVVAATGVAEPIIRRDLLSPGCHVNSVGHNMNGREVDAALVADSVVVVEDRSTVMLPGASGSQDLIMAAADLGLGDDLVHAELGELLTGERPGREAPDQITLFKGVGIGIEDAAAAGIAYRQATSRGAGTEIEL